MSSAAAEDSPLEWAALRRRTAGSRREKREAREIAGIPSRIPRENAEIRHCGVCANEEVWKREKSYTTSAPVAAERSRSETCACPRKIATPNFVHVEHFVESRDIWPWHE